jgi:DNA-binding MarR family transcriptional regulator
MTDPKQDRLSDQPASVTLSGRDLEDARRLIGLLVNAETLLPADVPLALYERLHGESGRLKHRARQILALRERRYRIFGKAMFREPAWDILLVLYTSGGGLSMNRLGQLARVSPATGLRWINYLSDHKLVIKEPHPTDARTFRIVLTDKGLCKLETYLSEADELGGT